MQYQPSGPLFGVAAKVLRSFGIEKEHYFFEQRLLPLDDFCCNRSPIFDSSRALKGYFLKRGERRSQQY
jgi:hypothetical protein